MKLLVVAVEEKSGTNAKGNDWKLFKAAFKGTKNKGTTFSTEAAPVLTKLRDDKTEALFTLHLTNADYNEYEIDKIMSEDGKTLLYEPKSRSGKGGRGGGGGYSNRPDWSYETAEERRETRLSIEAQKALEYAIRTLEAVIQYDEMTRGDAVAFVQETQAGYRELLRASVETGSGSASRSQGSGGPKGSRSSGAGQSDPQPASSRSEGLPSAGSGPASTDGQKKTAKVAN